MAIPLDRGESLKLVIKVAGDISADKARVYISQKQSTVLKYATVTTAGFIDIDAGVYNATTEKTEFTVDIEVSESLLLTFGLWDVTFWTAGNNAAFTEDFTRMGETEGAIQVNEPLKVSEL